MSQSKIKDHKVRSGRVISPWNAALGGSMSFSSWALSRLPEYIWLCLIHNHYGRDDGLYRAAQILKEISTYEDSLDKPKLSKILSLPKETQERIYESIEDKVEKFVLAPLTAIFTDSANYDVFRSSFYVNNYPFEVRIETIQDVLTKYYEHQSHDATDIRYLVLLNQIYQKKLLLSPGVESTAEALEKYPITSHDDEKMRSYRPMVRAAEIGMDEPDKEYIDAFWKGIGMATECKMFYLGHEKYDLELDEYLKETSDVIEYLYTKNKEESLLDEKFKVFTAMVVFAFKILKEIVENDMGNSISGRSSVRSLIEVYLMLKYLLKMSEEKTNIWQGYQQYGIGKYKLILLKAREADIDEDSHVKQGLLDILVNEDASEEFIDTDLRYFDQMNVRQKSVYVEEKELFDIYYDYDSNFTHALWGAVRESSMLKCDNAAHQFHAAPDFSSLQNCIDVIPDMHKIMKKIMSLLHEEYSLPEWYVEKYEI